MVEDNLQWRKEILADEELTHLIHHKYKIKNTTGYRFELLVDFGRYHRYYQSLVHRFRVHWALYLKSCTTLLKTNLKNVAVSCSSAH